MTGFNYTFDATQFAPDQGGPAHPVGKFRALISNTEVKPTKDGTGGMFVVEFTTEAGKISNRYNLWNNSQDAVRIAHGQLSALCHATGIHRVDMSNEGAALRNAQLMIEVGKQRGDETYTEVKRVYDVNGNEPGKAGAGPAAPAAGPQGGPGFGAPGGFTPQQPPQGQPGPGPAQGGWGAPQGQPQGQPQPGPQGAPQGAPGGWGQPQGAAPAPQGGNPAWGGGQPQGQPPAGNSAWGGQPTQQAAPQPQGGPQPGGWQQGGAPQGQPGGGAPWGAR